jgi:hypothetical protein
MLSDAELVALVGAGARVLRQEEVILPVAEVAHGMQAATDFQAVRSEGPAGFSISVTPSFGREAQLRFRWFQRDETLEILDLRNRKLDARPLSERGLAGPALFEGGQNVAYTRLAHSGDAAVVIAAELRVVVQRAENRLAILLAVDEEQGREVSAPSSKELTEWTLRCANKSLRERIGPLVEGNSWSRLVAAALLGRVQGLDTTGVIRSAVDLLAARLVEPGPSAWVGEQSPDSVEAIVAEAVRRAEVLRNRLANLDGSFAPFSDEWRLNFRSASWERGVLAAVRWLVRQHPRVGPLDNALDGVDAQGWPLLWHEEEEDAADPVLRTLASGDPASWWDRGR